MVSSISLDAIQSDVSKPAEQTDPERHSTMAAGDDGDKTWQSFSTKLREQDRKSAEVWRAEIDSMMTFAGLYSVILAAFNIELYKQLIPAEPTSDPNTHALILLISALNNVSMPSTVLTSIAPVDPPVTAIYINALMFASLALGLSSALIGLMIRDWLNFFLSPHSGEGERSTYIHCLRWNRGIVGWHVPGILSALSILLQIALALFLAGLLLFLWTVNRTVAIVATTIVCALGAFWIFTTVTPAISEWCPFKSPQALAFVWLFHLVKLCIRSSIKRLASLARMRRRRRDREGHRGTQMTLNGEDMMTTLRKFESWESIERSTFNAMIDGHRRHRETLKWICDNVSALGHNLLMDDNLFSHVIRNCLQNTMADTSLFNESIRYVKIHALPAGSENFNRHPNDAEIKKLEETSHIHAACSILRRIQAVVQGVDGLSHVARGDIALSASAVLTTLMETNVTLDDDADGYIQFLTPHICAGGPGPMAVVLSYRGKRAAEMRDTTDRVDTMTSTFVDGLLSYDYPSRIWAPDRLVLDEPGQKYALVVIKYIHESVLKEHLSPPPNSAHVDLLRRYNACGLAMLLAASIDPAGFKSILHVFVGNLKYFYDFNRDKHLEGPLLRWLVDGYKMLR